ncbi:unnamed protein product, partial [Ectocarpus sp. 12 AP-2014]
CRGHETQDAPQEHSRIITTLTNSRFEYFDGGCICRQEDIQRTSSTNTAKPDLPRCRRARARSRTTHVFALYPLALSSANRLARAFHASRSTHARTHAANPVESLIGNLNSVQRRSSLPSKSVWLRPPAYRPSTTKRGKRISFLFASERKVCGCSLHPILPRVIGGPDEETASNQQGACLE